MTKCDWDVLSEGMPWQTVKDMTKKPDRKDPLFKVITAFQLYLLDVCDQLRKTGLTLRHQMLEGVKYTIQPCLADNNDNEPGKTFHALQEKSTVESYHWTEQRRGLRSHTPSIILCAKKGSILAPQRRGSPYSGEGKK
jgi:hypothetical protein